MTTLNFCSDNASDGRSTVDALVAMNEHCRRGFTRFAFFPTHDAGIDHGTPPLIQYRLVVDRNIHDLGLATISPKVAPVIWRLLGGAMGIPTGFYDQADVQIRDEVISGGIKPVPNHQIARWIAFIDPVDRVQLH